MPISITIAQAAVYRKRDRCLTAAQHHATDDCHSDVPTYSAANWCMNVLSYMGTDDILIDLTRAQLHRVSGSNLWVIRFMDDTQKLLERTADIVVAFVHKNSLPHSELAGLIRTVHGALSKTSTPAQPVVSKPLAPAIPIKKSVTNDYIVCLEDGRQFKSLRRHLKAHYHLTPEAYREKWGLPKDYPMVAPAYAAARSELAKKSGLGASRRATRPKKT